MKKKELLDDLQKNTGYWKLKEESFCAEFAFEEVMDRSYERINKLTNEGRLCNILIKQQHGKFVWLSV